MKKIILGCAAVLLSLGLLAGCNNNEDEPPIEEAVEITVDSSASVVVGESLSLTYTVSPEKAEVVAASDNEDVVTAVAQEGTLYLEGVAEGSAIVTLVGTYEGYASANKNINVSVVTEADEKTEPGTQVPALTLSVETALSLEIPAEDEVTPTKIEYTVLPEEAEAKVTMEVTSGAEHVTLYSPEEAVEAELEDAWYVEPVSAGTSEITVSATAEGYTSAEETIVVTITNEGEETPEPVFESYTITVNLQTSTGTAFPDPGDTYGVWIQSSYDGTDNDHWGDAHPMTYLGSGVYTYTYTSVSGWSSEDGYNANIVAGHDGEPKWDNFNAENIKLKDTTSLTGQITDEFTIQSAIGDTWADIFPVESDVDVNFYVVIVFPDASSQDSFGSYQGFSQATVNCWNSQNYCSATYATTASSHSAFYSEEATAHENAEAEFSFQDYYNYSDRFQWLGSTNIVADSVYVVKGWINEQSWGSDDDNKWWNADVVGWQSLGGQTISEFVSSLTL